MGVRRSDRHPCLTSRPQPSMAARTPMRQDDVLGDRDGRGFVPAWLMATPMAMPVLTRMRSVVILLGHWRPDSAIVIAECTGPQSCSGFRSLNPRHDRNACRDVVAPGVGPSGTWMCHERSTDRTSARGMGQPPGRRRPLPEPAPPLQRFNIAAVQSSKAPRLKRPARQAVLLLVRQVRPGRAALLLRAAQRPRWRPRLRSSPADAPPCRR